MTAFEPRSSGEGAATDLPVVPSLHFSSEIVNICLRNDVGRRYYGPHSQWDIQSG